MRKATLLCAVVVLGFLAFVPCPAALVAEGTGAEQRIQSLREDITLLNLVNGLNLTRDQMTGLLSLAKEARDLRRAYFSDTSQTVKETEASFSELKGVLERSQEIPRQVEVRASGASERIKSLTQSYLDDMRGLSARAKKLLLGSQLVVIEDFKPCLIPPRNLKNPVRAGQAEEGEAGVTVLTRMRQMPEPIFEARRESMAEEYVSRIEKHLGRLGREERESAKRRFVEAIRKARGMDDVQFELSKEELAAELRPTSRIQEMRAELVELEQKTFGSPDKVGRFLLSERAIPIYEKRLGITGCGGGAEKVVELRAEVFAWWRAQTFLARVAPCREGGSWVNSAG